jgi:prepilin signal peptidase PulO-like enzyme (type II secretory pathway)
VGGFLADRMDRRLVMVGSDLTRAALIVFVPFLGIGGVYVIAFVHECISLLFLPARDASVPVLSSERQLPLANGLVLASSYGSIPFAAALFGILRIGVRHVPASMPLGHLIQTHPMALAFVFDALTFLVSAAMISRISLPHEKGVESVHLFSGLAESIRYAWRTPILRSLGEGLFVSMFGGGVLFAIAEGYYRIRGEEGMGMGDVKMLAMIGAFLGWKLTLVALVLASFTGSLVGILVLVSRRGGLKAALPFGTFLAIGAFIAATVGDRIIAWYVSLYS